MFFTPEHIQKMIDGLKDNTRRIVKPGEAYAFRYLGSQIEHVTDNRAAYQPMLPTSMITKVFTASGRLKWEVGRDYAVSPGRGKSGVWHNALMNGTHEWQQSRPGPHNRWKPLRIRLLAIRREPLQDITEGDAIAEGCEGDPGVIEYTTGQCDPPISPVEEYMQLWDSINTRKGARWDDNPDVWALTFEVVR